jgi:hypothetical protein
VPRRQPTNEVVVGFAALPPAMALVTFLGYLGIGASGQRVLAGGIPITDPVCPQPLVRISAPFNDPDWIFELKFDGKLRFLE